MNPIWDYVKKVEPHLQGGQRTQVAGALYTQLKAKKDAFEKSLGRKASEQEIADLLRAEGDPADVAARMSAGPHELELVTRYLAAIERRLPAAAAKDIVAELREALSGRIEAKEAQLGRALSTDEVADVLKGFGHPVVVASKYAGHDYLIGPDYYPWYWHVMRIALGLTVAITFGVVAVRALASDEPFRAVFAGIDVSISAAMICFGVVTALFIAAERTRLDLKWIQSWNPKMLPRDQIRSQKTLFECAVVLFFDAIFILWWVKVVNFSNEIPVRRDASVTLHFAQGWETVYWPILVLAIGSAVVHLADLVHPAWSRLRSAASIVGHAAGIGVLWVLFRSTPLINIEPVQGVDVEQAEKLFSLFNRIFEISLGVTSIVWAAVIGVEIWRQVKAGRTSGRLTATAA